MSTISLDGLPPSYRTPGTYFQTFPAQGPSSSPAGVRRATYLGPKTSEGTATVNTLYTVKSDADLVTLFGARSPVRRAGRIHFKENPTGKLLCMAYAETAGTAADGYVNLTGTATASGTLKLTVAGVDLLVSVNVGDSAATVAARMRDACLAKDYLPVVASVPSGSKLLLTAAVKGSSQGDGTTGVIRFRASLQKAAGISISNVSGAALGLGAGTTGVDGGSSEADLLTAALATLESNRIYYMGLCSAWNAAALSALVDHLDLKQTAVKSMPSVGVAGFTGTSSAAATLALAQNYFRLQLVNQPFSEHDVAELVGWTLANRQRDEQLDSRSHLTGKRSSNLKAVYDHSNWIDGEDENDMMTDGVSPIASDENGGYLVASISTKSKNDAGSQDDFRAAFTMKMSVCDEFNDSTSAKYQNTYQGFFIKDDKKKADGSIDFNQIIPPKTLTPFTFRPFMVRQIRDFEAQGKLQDADATIAALDVDLDDSNKQRLNVEANLKVIDPLTQVGIRVNEVSEG